MCRGLRHKQWRSFLQRRYGILRADTTRSMSNAPATIVVVDDDDDTVTFMRDFFTMLGMMVVVCPTNTRAVACIAEHHPSVIILDLRLEHITGVDVLHQVRADPTLQTVPVVFFTGSNDYLRQLLPDYAAHGAHLVVKPNVEQLSVLVQQLVQPSI